MYSKNDSISHHGLKVKDGETLAYFIKEESERSLLRLLELHHHLQPAHTTITRQSQSLKLPLLIIEQLCYSYHYVCT